MANVKIFPAVNCASRNISNGVHCMHAATMQCAGLSGTFLATVVNHASKIFIALATEVLFGSIFIALVRKKFDTYVPN
jgi:hypothetical protein